jgi:hypothetical protein
MSHSASESGRERLKLTSSRAVLTVGFLCSSIVAICAISSGSLWIDEFGTWFLTRADSIPDWWNGFRSTLDSDSQMPLYHFYMYVWAIVVGTDALAMRASNVGMFVMANLALLWPFRSRPTIALPIILTSCLSAPIWYYLNEIRPYIMLYMATGLMVGATIEILRSREKPSSLGIKVLCAGAVLSSGATVIGVVWAWSIVIFVLIYWLTFRTSSLSDYLKQDYFVLGIATFCITAIIAYNLMMIARGRLPALTHESNILTLIFSFYANLGLLGIGPGMLDMRTNGVGALVPFAPIIAFSTLLFGLVAIGGLLKIRILLGIHTIVLLISCTVLPVLFIFALGLVLNWRVLPRHLIPLVSLFSLLYAFGLAWWWRRPFVGRAAVLIAIIIMGYSSFSVRLAPRHAKDDYRHAAELAAVELAHDGRVWWVADFRGALYYGIPYLSHDLEWPQAGNDRSVRLAGEKSFFFLSNQEPPTLVLLSKSETYDRKAGVVKYLEVNNYHIVDSFPAFIAWRR